MMKIRHPEKVNKPINLIKKKPSWIRSKLINSREFFITKSIINRKKRTVKRLGSNGELNPVIRTSRD